LKSQGKVTLGVNWPHKTKRKRKKKKKKKKKVRNTQNIGCGPKEKEREVQGSREVEGPSEEY